MSTGAGIDYSGWDHIDVSDDEDVTSPYVDTPSLFRMRHRKRALMEQVAHQTIVIQLILDLARTLEVDPRGCFRQFFSRIKTADKPYLDMFDHELESLKERVRSRAQIRMESSMKELEEEERQTRLGPGGLDPVEVYESLPKAQNKR